MAANNSADELHMILEGAAKMTVEARDAAPQTQNCAACGGDATFKCTGCIESPDINLTDTETPTFYCNKTCQVDHRPIHKARCNQLKQRKCLLWTATLLRDTWLTLRTWAGDTNCYKVLLQNKDLIIHVDDGKMLETTRCVSPFPMGITDDKRLRDALLTFCTCQDAIAWLSPMLKELLEGKYKQVRGFNFDIKDPELYPKIKMPSGYIRPAVLFHSAWKIELLSGEVWAIDITGAQYGFCDHVMAWNKYCGERVETPTLEEFVIQSPAVFYETAILLHHPISLVDQYKYHEQTLSAGFFNKLNIELNKYGLPALKNALQGIPATSTAPAFETFKTRYLDMISEKYRTDFEKLYRNGEVAKMRESVFKNFLTQQGIKLHGRLDLKGTEAEIHRKEASIPFSGENRVA